MTPVETGRSQSAPTITALSTPPGEGGVAVIRVSGPRSLELLGRIFKSRKPIEIWESHRLYLGRIISAEGRLLDEAMAAFMRGPHSYTGEDTAELFCHGGRLVSNLVLQEIVRFGAVLAQPGEFTRRAFLNGRLDLIQAEAIADLIHAQSERALENAQRLLEGELSRQLDGMRERAAAILARLEAVIDFVDEEDVVALEKPALLSELGRLIADIDALLEGYRAGRLLGEGVRVVLAGRTNAGKSSLFNRFLGWERAIVHESPGTTRDFIEASFHLDGYHVILVDTAGFQATQEEVESRGLERSREQLAAADLVVFVVDGSRALTEEDQALLALVSHKPVFCVINKADLSAAVDPEILVSMKPGSRPLRLSVLTGEGISELKSAVLDWIKGVDVGEAPLLTRERQREALLRGRDFFAEALKAVEKGLSQEYVAADVKEGLDWLGRLMGTVHPEEILDRIFSQFCIGK